MPLFNAMFTDHIRVSRGHNHRNQGFALLVTIVLMAFLILIIVSLAAFTRVETQIASNIQQSNTARQNALMALNIAIGQLQQAAGPDQRVTARADILDTANTGLSTDNVKQPLWTGVWKTSDPANPIGNLDVDAAGSSGDHLRSWSTTNSSNPGVRAANTNMHWLVSGAADPVTNTAINPVNWTASPANSVVLAHTQLSPSSTIDTAVPLVPITATPPGFSSAKTIGNYAYWVADEGIKAKVNLRADPTLGKGATGSTYVQNQLHFLAPQATASHKIFATLNTEFGYPVNADPLAADFRNDQSVDKIPTTESLQFFTTAALSTPTRLRVKQFSADVTAFSYGVLADVRNGGLKKDLTAALEDESSGATQFSKLPGNGGSRGINGFVYRVDDARSVPTKPASLTYKGASTGQNIEPMAGLFWRSLYSYYNLYKANMPQIDPTETVLPPPGINSAATWPLNSSSMPFSLQMRSNYITLSPSQAGGAAVKGYPVLADRLLPVVLCAGVDGALASYISGSSYKLEMRYYPRLVLYNPYSVSLKLPAGTNYQVQMDAYQSNASYDKNVITVTVDSDAAARTSKFLLNQANDLYRLTLTASPGVLQPGEIRFFGLSANGVRNTDTTKGMNAAINFPTLVSTSSTIPDHYQSTVIPDYQSYGSIIADRSKFTVNGNGDGFSSTTNSGAMVHVTTNSTSTGLTALLQFANFNSYALPTNARVLAPRALNSKVTQSWPAEGVPIQLLATTPRRVMSVIMRAKGIVPSASATSYLNASNALPLMMGNNPDFNIMDSPGGTMEVLSLPVGSILASGDDDIQVIEGRTSWGNGSTGADPFAANQLKVLRDVPNQPMASIGQFMHMPTHYTANFVNSLSNYPAPDGISVGYYFLHFPSTFVGGSYPCANIDTKYNADTTNWVERMMLDHSFRANEALFDTCYFSTFPSVKNSSPATSVYPAPYNSYTQSNIAADSPLPNNRMRFYNKNGVEPQLADLRDVEKSAANLLLDGAFNINSTSVNAWRALLSSLSGNAIALYNLATGSVTSLNAATLQNPIPRFWNATQSGLTNTAWEGMRTLSDDEVTTLATQIVKEVKTRGPFLSMGDFLNRRLGPSGPLTRKGALQAAIDATSLNANLKDNFDNPVGTAVSVDLLKPYKDNGPTAATYMTPEPLGTNCPPNTAVGIPGYLMQQDIVQAFSPVMTARSDTFTIRTYGETVNPVTSEVITKAWLEAVVQRVPDFVDQTDSAITASGLGSATAITSLNDINKQFGRRFKLVSFRWITPNDL